MLGGAKVRATSVEVRATSVEVGATLGLVVAGGFFAGGRFGAPDLLARFEIEPAMDADHGVRGDVLVCTRGNAGRSVRR